MISIGLSCLLKSTVLAFFNLTKLFAACSLFPC